MANWAIGNVRRSLSIHWRLNSAITPSMDTKKAVMNSSHDVSGSNQGRQGMHPSSAPSYMS